MEIHKQPAGTAVYHKISLSRDNRPRLSKEGWETQTRNPRRRAGPDLKTAHTRADESCQSAFTAFLLLQAGRVSPPVIPPGTHRWKLLMAPLCGWAWLGYDSRTPGAGAAECRAILAGKGLVWGSHFKQESTESGGWRTRRGSGCLVMYDGHLSEPRSGQLRRFSRAVWLWCKAREHGSEWKHQFLPWPGLDVSLEPDETNCKREKREEKTFKMIAQVFKITTAKKTT